MVARAARDDFTRILRDEGFGTDGGRAAGGCGGLVTLRSGATTGEVEDLGRLTLGILHLYCGDRSVPPSADDFIERAR